jgi:hypothetical protein
MMHFLLISLIIKVLYMFQALLAHPWEELHKWCLVYACYVSWLHRDWCGTSQLLRSVGLAAI